MVLMALWINETCGTGDHWIIGTLDHWNFFGWVGLGIKTTCGAGKVRTCGGGD